MAFQGYIVAGDETGVVTAANLGHIDVELRGNTVSAVFQRCDGEVGSLGDWWVGNCYDVCSASVPDRSQTLRCNNITNDFSTLMGAFW